MLIVVDWKENYAMKGDIVATGREFYNKVLVVYCKDIENGKPQQIPIVSNVLTHDATTAKWNTNKALAKLKTMHPAPVESLKCISVWADTGPHYRNLEFCYYVCHDLLVDYNLRRTKLNYFGESHG